MKLFLFEAAGKEGSRDSDVREVPNYVHALWYGLERFGSLPLSLRLLRELPERLMHGIRAEPKTPGQFRQKPNWIGPRNATLDNAIGRLVESRIAAETTGQSRYPIYCAREVLKLLEEPNSQV